MSAWLFDLGNTRLKYARREVGGVGEMASLDHHAGADFGELPESVRGEVAWVSAVAPAPVRAALLQALGPRFARISIARTLRQLDIAAAFDDDRPQPAANAKNQP